MPAETSYKSVNYVYRSRGLWARWALDECPEYAYLDLLNCLERGEEEMSSRFGTQIINRDPNGTPSGQNYFFSSPVTNLAKLNYQSGAWRYAGLSDGSLYRRSGNTQGQYSQLAAPGTFSGGIISTVIDSCFETAQPYIFFYDSNASLKDDGTFSDLELIGLDPPDYTANSLPYAPLLTLIDGFASANTYATSNITGWAFTPITTLQPFIGSMVTDFPQFLETGITIAGGTTTAYSSGGTPGSAQTVYSGFASLAIDGQAQLIIPLSGDTFNTIGGAGGGGGITVEYSTNAGSTWTVLYGWSSGVPGVLPEIPLTVNIYVGNAMDVQVRVTSTASSSKTNTVRTDATISLISLSVANTAAFGEVVSGMIANLGAAVGGLATSTIYATQYATNISFNATQYEYNAPLIRTAGGVTGGTLTDYVIATGFGLAIPGTATITGIEVVERWEGQATGSGIIKGVQLYYMGSPYGTAKSVNVSNVNYFINSPFGSDDDLWGATPTPVICNDPTFGFGVQIEAIDVGTTRSFLNSFTINVYYTTGGGSGAGTISSIAIEGIVSSGYDAGTGLYTTLTITTVDVHGLTGSPAVAVYGTSNDLADGYYTGTVVDTVTLTVPFLSAASISATGGTLWAVTGGTPEYCVLANLYTTPYPTQLSAWGFYAPVPTTVTGFPVNSWAGTIATDTSGYIGSTIDLDLSQNNQVTDADLIVLTLQIGSPANIESIQLEFDVNGSGYTSSYYQATISPAYYQGLLDGSQTAYETTENQILADTLGLLTGQQPTGSTTAQLSPSNFSTGSDAWATVYIPRGNILPVGNAGAPGLDWSAITGWRISVQTTAAAVTGDGSSTIACNGLYLQWGYGPSSFAGTGYDWRYTYYNANTGTESSPSDEQAFSQQYGYLASLSAPFYLRQAAQITGQYSADPQVTHIRMYRRGGTYSSNWYQIDQFANLTGQGQFYYKDVVADAALEEAEQLVLDNDPPVTSSLLTPIQTTISAATSSPGQSIYSIFNPQVIQVADNTAEFVVNQIVLVGNAYNLEEVLVVIGGTGQFTGIVRLQHNAGEPIQVNSVPRAMCNLAAVAYGQVWLAGDPNNPHYLYYSKPGYPENFGPQNYIPVSTPDDPIMAVINWRGTLLVATFRTWFIINGGAQPYAQPTGSQHGMVASQGWTQVESAIWYRASDGQRQMTGADGVYKSLPVEWVYQGNPQCIPPQADQTQISKDVFAYYNNKVYDSYISTSGARYRMSYDTIYQRFRYDDVAATAMLWERDTNLLLVGKEVSAGNYAVVIDQTGDYDDGGWSSGVLVQTPINLSIQTPYRDLGAPNFLKQWNMFETDVNTQNQPMTTTLLFEDGQESVALANVTTTQRTKVPLQIEAGAGYEAYRASVRHTMSVTVAPILFQDRLYADVLPDVNTSMDSYWMKFGTDLSKFIKQGYFDYTADAEINISLYADNSLTAYFTFTLPITTQRYVQRVRFGNLNSGTTAFTMRTWRMIATSTGNFQWWANPQIMWKPVGTTGYKIAEIVN